MLLARQDKQTRDQAKRSHGRMLTNLWYCTEAHVLELSLYVARGTHGSDLCFVCVLHVSMCQQDSETLCCSSGVLSSEVRLEECERSGWKQSKGKRRLLRGPGRGEERVFSGSGCLAGLTCGLETLFTKMQQKHCEVISVPQCSMCKRY